MVPRRLTLVGRHRSFGAASAHACAIRLSGYRLHTPINFAQRRYPENLSGSDPPIAYGHVSLPVSAIDSAPQIRLAAEAGEWSSIQSISARAKTPSAN